MMSDAALRTTGSSPGSSSPATSEATSSGSSGSAVVRARAGARWISSATLAAGSAAARAWDPSSVPRRIVILPWPGAVETSPISSRAARTSSSETGRAVLSAVNATGGSTSMVRIDAGSAEGVKASAPPVSAATPAARTARPETFMTIPTYRSINPPTMNLPACQLILRISQVTGRRVAVDTRGSTAVRAVRAQPGSTRSVSTCASPSVIAMVCSLWAVREPSAERIVHPSGS